MSPLSPAAGSSSSSTAVITPGVDTQTSSSRSTSSARRKGKGKQREESARDAYTDESDGEATVVKRRDSRKKSWQRVKVEEDADYQPHHDQQARSKGKKRYRPPSSTRSVSPTPSTSSIFTAHLRQYDLTPAPTPRRRSKRPLLPQSSQISVPSTLHTGDGPVSPRRRGKRRVMECVEIPYNAELKRRIASGAYKDWPEPGPMAINPASSDLSEEEEDRVMERGKSAVYDAQEQDTGPEAEMGSGQKGDLVNDEDVEEGGQETDIAEEEDEVEMVVQVEPSSTPPADELAIRASPGFDDGAEKPTVDACDMDGEDDAGRVPDAESCSDADGRDRREEELPLPPQGAEAAKGGDDEIVDEAGSVCEADGLGATSPDATEADGVIIVVEAVRNNQPGTNGGYGSEADAEGETDTEDVNGQVEADDERDLEVNGELTTVVTEDAQGGLAGAAADRKSVGTGVAPRLETELLPVEQSELEAESETGVVVDPDVDAEEMPRVPPDEADFIPREKSKTESEGENHAPAAQVVETGEAQAVRPDEVDFAIVVEIHDNDQEEQHVLAEPEPADDPDFADENTSEGFRDVLLDTVIAVAWHPEPAVKQEALEQVAQQAVADLGRAVGHDSKPLPSITSSSWCHHCRRKTDDPKMLCNKALRRGKKCLMQYCKSCCKRYDFTFELHSTSFVCPRCTDTCICSKCLKKRGLPPVGAKPKGRGSQASRSRTWASPSPSETQEWEDSGAEEAVSITSSVELASTYGEETIVAERARASGSQAVIGVKGKGRPNGTAAWAKERRASKPEKPTTPHSGAKPKTTIYSPIILRLRMPKHGKQSPPGAKRVKEVDSDGDTVGGYSSAEDAPSAAGSSMSSNRSPFPNSIRPPHDCSPTVMVKKAAPLSTNEYLSTLAGPVDGEGDDRFSSFAFGASSQPDLADDEVDGFVFPLEGEDDHLFPDTPWSTGPSKASSCTIPTLAAESNPLASQARIALSAGYFPAGHRRPSPSEAPSSSPILAVPLLYSNGEPELGSPSYPSSPAESELGDIPSLDACTNNDIPTYSQIKASTYIPHSAPTTVPTISPFRTTSAFAHTFPVPPQPWVPTSAQTNPYIVNPPRTDPVPSPSSARRSGTACASLPQALQGNGLPAMWGWMMDTPLPPSQHEMPVSSRHPLLGDRRAAPLSVSIHPVGTITPAVLSPKRVLAEPTVWVRKGKKVWVGAEVGTDGRVPGRGRASIHTVTP